MKAMKEVKMMKGYVMSVDSIFNPREYTETRGIYTRTAKVLFSVPFPPSFPLLFLLPLYHKSSSLPLCAPVLRHQSQISETVNGNSHELFSLSKSSHLCMLKLDVKPVLIHFYAPHLYRQVLLRRVLAMRILSVCPSVCHDPVVYQDQVR